MGWKPKVRARSLQNGREALRGKQTWTPAPALATLNPGARATAQRSLYLVLVRMSLQNEACSMTV